jgi:acyl-CoA synthetase (AMP-forming)/AMP-acid ligase II
MSQLLLHDFFLAVAARHPDRVAAWRDGDALTFAETAHKTEQMARALAAAGLGRSDRLVWWGETDLDLVPLLLATASLGAIFAPINPSLTRAEAALMLDLADPRLVVVDEQRDGQLRLSDLTRSTVTSGIDSGAVQESDGHVMYFTSGTTGTPKAIALSHRTTMLRALPALAEVPRGPLVSMFPLFHMSGWSSAIGPWLCGEEVVLADGGDAEGLVRAIEKHRAHRFYGIPAVWRRILELDLNHYDLTSLKSADTGTSATTVELLTAIHDALPHTTATVTYGSTEASGVCKLPFEDLQRKPGSVGPPWPGVMVRIDDGQLLVKSPFLFDGYFRNAAATEAAFVDGWYQTGELADIDDEGYVSILGRVSDMIRSGGETISPAEVDTVLLEHPAVVDAASAGVPDDSWGEIVTAFLVLRPGASITLEELQQHCNNRLARYKTPRRLVLVDSIPRTGATRQVQRRQLVQKG